MVLTEALSEGWWLSLIRWIEWVADQRELSAHGLALEDA